MIVLLLSLSVSPGWYESDGWRVRVAAYPEGWATEWHCKDSSSVLYVGILRQGPTGVEETWYDSRTTQVGYGRWRVLGPWRVNACSVVLTREVRK